MESAPAANCRPKKILIILVEQINRDHEIMWIIEEDVNSHLSAHINLIAIDAIMLKSVEFGLVGKHHSRCLLSTREVFQRGNDGLFILNILRRIGLFDLDVSEKIKQVIV